MRERMWENCTQTLAENSEDFPLKRRIPRNTQDSLAGGSHLNAKSL